LVDGWEALLADEAELTQSVRAFADGRAGAIASLSRKLAVSAPIADGAARRWAIAELAMTGLSFPADKLLAEAGRPGRLPRALRPLAILSGLSQRARVAGSRDALGGLGALLAAIRLGIVCGPA